MIKPLILFPFIFKYQVIGVAILGQWHGNSVLSCTVLLEQKRGKRFINAFKLGIERTIVKLYLFNDRTAFNIVIAVKKL